MTFTFESNNAQGTNPVTKVIAYVPMTRYGQEYFNLEFGDFNVEHEYMDDLAVTDNGDMRKVLKTVASTLEIFFSEFPDRKVHFDGSDPRRHAYYHKLVRDYHKFIVPLYCVEGYVDDRHEIFKPGREYEFIVVTKR